MSLPQGKELPENQARLTFTLDDPTHAATQPGYEVIALLPFGKPLAGNVTALRAE
ncbi:MAG TPA: hypothetical protein VFA89_12650 [Terriglobales bacterium]|nr:hypothetical protein [Terriglobales bacterium]